MSANNCSTTVEFSGYISFAVICEWNNSRLVVSSLKGIKYEYYWENYREKNGSHVIFIWSRSPRVGLGLDFISLDWFDSATKSFSSCSRASCKSWKVSIDSTTSSGLSIARSWVSLIVSSNWKFLQENVFFFNLIFFEIEINHYYLRKSALLCLITGWIWVYSVFGVGVWFDSWMYKFMWKINITIIKITENASAITKRSISFLVPIAFTIFAVIFAQLNWTKSITHNDCDSHES